MTLPTANKTVPKTQMSSDNLISLIAPDEAVMALFGFNTGRMQKTKDRIIIERAIADFRAGYPVLMHSKTQGGGVSAYLLMSAETLHDGQIALFSHISRTQPRLVLTASRLRHLGIDTDEPASILLNNTSRSQIDGLITSQNIATQDGLTNTLEKSLVKATDIDRLALELASFALMLPAVVIVTLDEPEGFTARDGFAKTFPMIVSFQAESLAAYRASQNFDLRLVSRAYVPLDNNITSEFVVFRGGEGLRDQVAILVGKPDLSKPVHVRLHSACLTGDLFGSLKCDCGDQLRGTVNYMAENGGGILLYLDQEGRGTGIGNKMRAYALQAEGLDTYEADSVLGFEIDHRSYGFAAHMLKLLGVTKISLLTNNPTKIAAMRDQGLEVLTHERVMGRQTRQNKSYLAAKRDKAGHLFAKDAG